MGSIIQLKATSTGGIESALATIDSPLDGEIVGVEFTVDPVYDTTLDRQVWQLGFGSAIVLTNDSRSVIANFTAGALVFTAGGSYLGGSTHYSQIPGIRISMGERIFLHSTAAAGMVSTCYCLMHCTFDLDLPKARRR